MVSILLEVFSRKDGEDFQFDENIFSDGLVQPPTSYCLQGLHP